MQQFLNKNQAHVSHAGVGGKQFVIHKTAVCLVERGHWSSLLVVQDLQGDVASEGDGCLLRTEITAAGLSVWGPDTSDSPSKRSTSQREGNCNSLFAFRPRPYST